MGSDPSPVRGVPITGGSGRLPEPLPGFRFVFEPPSPKGKGNKNVPQDLEFFRAPGPPTQGKIHPGGRGKERAPGLRVFQSPAAHPRAHHRATLRPVRTLLRTPHRGPHQESVLQDLEFFRAPSPHQLGRFQGTTTPLYNTVDCHPRGFAPPRAPGCRNPDCTSKAPSPTAQPTTQHQVLGSQSRAEPETF